MDFHTQAIQLTADLADAGIRALKIWPFDLMAKQTGGRYITAEPMQKGLEVLESALCYPDRSKLLNRLRPRGWKSCCRRTT